MFAFNGAPYLGHQPVAFGSSSGGSFSFDAIDVSAGEVNIECDSSLSAGFDFATTPGDCGTYSVGDTVVVPSGGFLVWYAGSAPTLSGVSYAETGGGGGGGTTTTPSGQAVALISSSAGDATDTMRSIAVAVLPLAAVVAVLFMAWRHARRFIG